MTVTTVTTNTLHCDRCGVQSAQKHALGWLNLAVLGRDGVSLPREDLDLCAGCAGGFAAFIARRGDRS